MGSSGLVLKITKFEACIVTIRADFQQGMESVSSLKMNTMTEK